MGFIALIHLFQIELHATGNNPIPTFAEEIAPIFYGNCVVCHRPDGVGPFSLKEYPDVSRRARQIADVVESRFMPPWKPEAGHGPPLIGERRLTENEISSIVAWAEAGAPSGNLETAPQPPEFPDSWTLGEPDWVLELPEAYELPAEGGDFYRNFVIPLPFKETRWVGALEFLPETKWAIHHAVIQVDSTTWARERDSLDDVEPGFDGMDLRNITYPQGKTIRWAPGRIPYEAFPGTAWELPTGADLELIKAAARDYQAKLLGGKDHYFFALAMNLETTDRMDDAMTAYQLALKLNPGHAKALNNLGLLLEQRGDHQLAREYFLRAVESDKTLDVALFNLARSMIAEGNPTDAKPLLQTITRRSPENLHVWLSIATIEIERDRFHEAINVLNSASVWHGDEPTLLLELGKLYSTVNDHIQAQLHFEKALRPGIGDRFTTKQKAETYYALALVRKIRGNFPQAQENALNATRLSPDDHLPRLLLADIALTNGHIDLCRKQVNMLLDNRDSNSLTPGDIAANLPFPKGVILIAGVLREKGETNNARALLEKVREYARRNNQDPLLELIEKELGQME